MRLTKQQQLLIQEYLSDNLSDNHQAEFNEQVKDPAFRRSLWLQANVLYELEQDQQNKLRKEIKSYNGVSRENVIAKKQINYAWLKYTIIILAIIGSLFIFKTIISSHTVDDQSLYAKYYQPYPIEDITRGKADQIPQLQNILDAYQKQDFDLFLGELNKNPSIPNTKIYKLIALLELDKFQEAQLLIKDLKLSSVGTTLEVAEWYEVLLLLKQNKFKQASNLVETYSYNNNHLFQKELENLLSDLNNK